MCWYLTYTPAWLNCGRAEPCRDHQPTVGAYIARPKRLTDYHMMGYKTVAISVGVKLDQRVVETSKISKIKMGKLVRYLHPLQKPRPSSRYESSRPHR